MKSPRKDLLKKWALLIIKILIILTIVSIIIYVFYWKLFLYSCKDENCFNNSLKNCRPSTWIKENDESVWLMTIRGNVEQDSCNIKFKLLDIKKGTIDSENLVGKEMTCIVTKTENRLPPEDMAKCTGLLKEEMQDILIKRMHDYLLRNIGELKQEFKTVYIE